MKLCWVCLVFDCHLAQLDQPAWQAAAGHGMTDALNSD